MDSEEKDAAETPEPELLWHVVRTRPKSEHLAAAAIRKQVGVEVFCPRLRFEKGTRRGKVWFVEALFPGYIFARIDLTEHLRYVQSINGVTGLVRFGENFSVLEPGIIDALKGQFTGEEETREIRPEIGAGDEVQIVEGAMRGLTVLVTRVISAQKRVAILFEWLGQDREAEIPVSRIVRKGNVRSDE